MSGEKPSRGADNSRKPRVFYGWWVVLVCLLCLFFMAGMAFYSLGAFFLPLEEGFGWSRAQIAAAITIYFGTLGLMGPLVGRLVHRYGARRVMLLGALVAGLGFALLSRTQTLWHFYAFYGIGCVGLSGMGVVPVGTVVANWFIQRRGMAMGVAITGIGFGGFLAPVASFLISASDWRQSYLALALLPWVLIAPLVALVIRTRPEEMGLLPDGEVASAAYTPQVAAPDAEESGWTLAAAMRAPSLWLITIAFLLGLFAIIGVMAHEVPYFTDLGIASETTAALALGITGNMGILGKFIFGYLADRLSVKKATVLYLILQALGIALLMLTRTTAMMWVSVIVFGFAMGGNPTLQPLVVAHRFGLAAFATIFGLVTMFVYLGAAASPLLAGLIYDATHSYHWAFVILLSLQAVALASFVSARLFKEGQPKAFAKMR